MTIDVLISTLQAKCDKGRVAMASARWQLAVTHFSGGIEFAQTETSFAADETLSEDDSYDFDELLGWNFTGRALSALAQGHYAACLSDLATGIAIMPFPLYPICYLSQLQSCCDDDVFFSPSSALVSATAAIVLAKNTPEYCSAALIVRAMANISCCRFEAASVDLAVIPESERVHFDDYRMYVTLATERRGFRRSASGFASRIQAAHQYVLGDDYAGGD